MDAVFLSNNGYIEIYTSTCKYWEGEGLPTYEGSIEGLLSEYPYIFQELVTLLITIEDDKLLKMTNY